MRPIRIIVLGLLAALVVLGGTTTSSATKKPTGPPDTYVTDWDAVGTQAFTAAGSRPPKVTRSSPTWRSRSTTR